MSSIIETRRGPLTVLSINRPQVLNALSEEALSSLAAALTRAENDPLVHCVVIVGEGKKGYCAGGDVKLVVLPPEEFGPDYARRFFETEYGLYERIYSYSKPLAVYGHGISMGGGLGLMQGATVRAIAEDATLAMPEISIGLYPDVGASYFLPRLLSPWQSALQQDLGLWLGLTGARLNAIDAVNAGLADCIIPLNQRDPWLNDLEAAPWSDTDRLANFERFGAISQNAAQIQVGLPPSALESELSTLSDLLRARTVMDFAEQARAIQSEIDAQPGRDWLKQCLATFLNGSRLSAFLTWETYHRGKSLSLSHCFAMELHVSLESCRYGEFKEGVRAHLIEKDGKPKWNPSDWASVGPSLLSPFFQSNH